MSKLKKQSNENSLLVSSSIEEVDPNLLKQNPLSAVMFGQENGDYFKDLISSIKEYGVAVPLIVSPDNTIYCGHNRHMIALQLGLKKVPIQRTHKVLTEEESRKFMLDEQLKRRQFTRALRRKIYEKHILAFEERLIVKPPRGNHTNPSALMSKEVSKKTGIDLHLVKRDLVAFRKEKIKEQKQFTQKEGYIDEQEINRIKKVIRTTESKMYLSHPKTINEAVRLLKIHVQALSDISKSKKDQLKKRA